MSIHYKFLSSKDYSSVSVHGTFVSVGLLKELIMECKYKSGSMGTDLDIVIINAQTRDAYLHDSDLIPSNSSVLIRRIPGNRRRQPIDTFPILADPPTTKQCASDLTLQSGSKSSVTTVDDDDLWDYDVYAPYDNSHTSSSIEQSNSAPCVDKGDGNCRIKGLVNTFASQNSRFPTSCGEGRSPPPGYVCHRCNVAGHYIQLCPTHRDPTYDSRRQQPPTGIPKSMPMVDSNGSLERQGDVSTATKPNEDAFGREMGGLSSSSSNSSSFRTIPSELHCPLCNRVMKEAVLTSRCCFGSFCYKCIRDHLVNSKMNCVCGKQEILTDYLIPNMTLREAINRILGTQTWSSGSESADSVIQPPERGTASFQLPSASFSTEKKRPRACLDDNSQTKEAERKSAVLRKKRRMDKASEDEGYSMAPHGPYSMQGFFNGPLSYYLYPTNQMFGSTMPPNF